MRAASTNLKARLAVEATSLCRLWRIKRKDGSILRFTDAVRPVTIDVGNGDGSQTYRSDLSFIASAILTSQTNANLQSYTLQVIMSDDGFSETVIRQRKFDNAQSTLFVCDYAFPQHGIVNMFEGVVGEIQLSNQKVASVTIVPNSGALAGKAIGLDKYSQTCRASLGDSKCKIDIEALAVSFTVASGSGGSFVATALNQDNAHWGLGFVKWLTGANAGTQSGVQSNNKATTSVFLTSPPLFPIALSDTGKIYPGCDKLRQTCLIKYNNVENLRAEPDVPDGTGAPGSNYSTSDALMLG